MTSHRRFIIAGLALAATAASGLLAGSPAGAAGSRSNSGAVEQGKTYERFIVHFSGAAASNDAAAQRELDDVGSKAGHKLDLQRRLSTSGVLLSVDERLDADKANKLIAKFLERSTVSYVEPDVTMTATLTPNDSNYLSQWHYHEAVAGMNLPAAWDSTVNDGAGQVVAVLDTGVTSHSDLAANLVSGYDFVSSATAARDGNGRDSDPSDQGDWYVAGECGQPFGSNSSWHGTHVAGTIAAVTNNAKGVSGVAFNAKVQPVRVLGKCGGTLADIADAITWASGGTVLGVPANPTPAKVINMSLGGGGTCGATYQNAINGAVSRGTTVVVAAGNSNANAANYQPASCANVVSVVASDRQGNRASYSNYGTIVDVTAPGGETATSTNGVLSTLNTGTTTPGAEAYAYYQGTSMATPHVAGLAALMLGEKALTPADIESTLKANTRPLAGTCSGGCGTGLVDAAKSIAALSGATPPPPPPPPPAGESFFENVTDYQLADKQRTDSPITVSGRTGNAPSTLKVNVDIKHTFRGDLQIDLVAPDGSLYRLKNSSTSDSADNVLGTYTVNASAEVANGTWKLRVWDRYNGDTGYIDVWSLQF